MFHRDWASAVVGRGDTGQHLRMTTLFSLGNFCKKKFPIYYFPGPPDVGAIQGAVAVWSCNSSQMSGKIRERLPKAQKTLLESKLI